MGKSEQIIEEGEPVVNRSIYIPPEAIQVLIFKYFLAG